jgi:hypothetical protein
MGSGIATHGTGRRDSLFIPDWERGTESTLGKIFSGETEEGV